MFQTIQQKARKNLLNKARTDIVQAEMMIEFYQSEHDNEEDAAKQGKIRLKMDSLQDSIDFNTRFLEVFE